MEFKNFINKKISRLFSDDKNLKPNYLELVCLPNQNNNDKSTPEITTVGNFECTENVLTFFDSHSTASILKDFNKVFLIKLKIKDINCNLSAHGLNILSRKCANNSVVIFLVAEKEQNYFLYWKSNKIQHYLMFKIYNGYDVMNNFRLFDFIANFVAESLRYGHLGIHNQVEIQTDSNSYELHLLADHRNYNLLLVAAEVGNIFMVNFMLDGGFRTEAYDTNAQTLAWNGRHFEIVAELLKSNHTFPDSINIDECPDSIKIFHQISSDLNEAMMLGNTVKVLEILSSNQGIKFFYNLNNESAIAFALKNKLFDMYRLLISKDFRLGPHEKFSEFKESMKQNDKKELREIHYKESKYLPDNHMHVLLSNSRLGHGTTDTENKFKIIQKAFEILNENPFIQVILMIVAASRNFRIIFDFNFDSVEVMDPTANDSARGLFYLTGRIYIAAKKLLNESTKYEALGTLAHELCHYAVNIVFKNFAKPYESNDDDAKEEFVKVLSFCKENCHKEEIINFVFKCYPSNMRHAELIVRAPHLMMLYCNEPNKLREIRTNFHKLFTIFEDKIIPKMKEALPSIEARAECAVQRKNKKIRNLKFMSIVGGLVSIILIISGILITRKMIHNKSILRFSSLSNPDKMKIENAPISYKNIPLQFQDLFPKSSKVYDMLLPDQISYMLIDKNSLNLSDPNLNYLDGFINHNCMNLTEKLKDKVLASNFMFQNITVKFKILNSIILESLTSQQIIDILDNKTIYVHEMIKNETNFYIERNFFHEKIYEIYFEFMKTVGKSKIVEKCNYFMTRKMSFEEFYRDFIRQNFIIQLKIVNSIYESKEFDECLVFDFKLTNETTQEVIETIFSHKSLQLNLNEVLEEANKTKLFILSSDGGTGKTVIFQQIAIRFKIKSPNLWVSFINLRDFREFYKNVENLEDIKKLLQNMFDLNSKTEFEKTLFDEYFMSGKVVLIWNGYDEICPEYSKVVLKIFKIIKRMTKNIQFISTATLYSRDIVKKFFIESYTIIPFNLEEQELFLRKFYISSNLKDETKIKNYIEKIRSIVDSTIFEQDFSTPLLLKMIAAFVSNDKQNSKTKNVYKIYENFFDIKIRNFLEMTKNQTTRDDLMKLYQKYALKSVPKKLAFLLNSKNLEIMKFECPNNITNDEISSMQIVNINEPNMIKFAHKSYADFFVAQYLIQNIYNLNRNEDVPIVELDYRLRVFCGSFDHVRITNFIVHYSIHANENKTIGKFHPKVSNLLKSKFERILVNSLDKHGSYLIPMLLSFFEKDHELLVELLHVNENKTFYTELYNYANAAFVDFETLNIAYGISMIAHYLNETELIKLVLGKNQKGVLLFSSYCYYKKDGVYRFNFTSKMKLILKSNDPQYVFDYISSNLTTTEYKELLTSKTILYFVKLDEEIYNMFNQNMWRRIEKNLSVEEQRHWLKDIIQLISFSPKPKENQVFFSKIHKLFSNSEIMKMFQDNQILQILASYDPQTFSLLWNFYIKHTTRDEQKIILSQTVQIKCTGDFVPDEDCYLFPSLNILQSSLLNENYIYVITDFYSIYQNYFEEPEIHKLLLNSDNFLPFFFVKQYPEDCRSFLTYLKDIYKENVTYLLDVLKKTRNDLCSLPNIVEKCEILSDAIDDLSY